jgi:hypothetical protein
MSPTCKLIAVLSCAGLLASAENIPSASRILAFDAKVIVSKNRDLAVNERIEIANHDGFFDSGLHRYLLVKPASRERAKPGSFESIQAKVDGRDAQVVTQASDTFDIGIPAEGGSWSRGNHVIELSYTAKNQFAVYEASDDLNQNITGKWAVPIEKATVELNFPAGAPPRLSISADTGSVSDFKFDCLQTNLPSGIRFEATHPIPPGQRLFVSARFMQKDYFVSDAAASGTRAILAKHHLLSPAILVFATLLVLTVLAYLLAPKAMPGYDAAPNWIRVLVLASLPGTAALALRLVYEQTVMTWRDGKQMVGFALAHAYILFFLPMVLSLAVAHLGLACVLSVTLARWLRRLPTPKWNWLVVATLAIGTALVYLPYDFWMTTTVRIAGPGPHGASFLMMAAADNKLPLAKILIANGISPNTEAGGSTALDVACSSRNLDVAKFLLERGAQISHAPSCASLALSPHGSRKE